MSTCPTLQDAGSDTKTKLNLDDCLFCLRVEEVDSFRNKGKPNLFVMPGAARRVHSSNQVGLTKCFVQVF